MPLILQRVALGCLLGTLAHPPIHAADPPPDPFRQAVDNVQKAARQHRDGTEPYFAELEQGFRRLQKEFPNQGEVYDELLFVADHSSKEKAIRLASEVLQWPAPELSKAKARGLLKKLEILGQPWTLKLSAIDGRPIDLAAWKGKVILLDFWASWCPPCVESLPELKRLYARHQPDGFEIVGMNFDDSIAALKRFLAKDELPWPQYSEGRGLKGLMAAGFGITSLPTMWLVDRKGILRDVHAEKDLKTKLETLLKESP